MSLKKPFKRTCRQLLDGSYSNSGNSLYLIHKDFANDPQHYIRGFLLLQKDFLELIDFIEPCDQNLPTISFRIHELLMRACIEIEANFTAILKENKYSKNSREYTSEDFKLINISHRLSSYKASLPIWKGLKFLRCPFEKWNTNEPLVWYQAYNKSKHSRHEHFDKATFENLVDAICGLAILISAQFHDENYSPNDKVRSIGTGYSYEGLLRKFAFDYVLDTAVGEYFQILYPKDWPNEERYHFNWSELKNEEHPVDSFNYDALIK